MNYLVFLVAILSIMLIQILFIICWRTDVEHLIIVLIWNKKNIEQILKVNNRLWKCTDELKKEQTELNNLFKSSSETEPKFQYYSIEGQIEYHGSEANDIATMELQRELSLRAAFHFWSLNLDENTSQIRDSIHEEKILTGTLKYLNHIFLKNSRISSFIISCTHYLLMIIFSVWKI